MVSPTLATLVLLLVAIPALAKPVPVETEPVAIVTKLLDIETIVAKLLTELAEPAEPVETTEPAEPTETTTETTEPAEPSETHHIVKRHHNHINHAHASIDDVASEAILDYNGPKICVLLEGRERCVTIKELEEQERVYREARAKKNEKADALFGMVFGIVSIGSVVVWLIVVSYKHRN